MHVWEFLQVDAEELPDTMIDRWVREGFTRIANVSKRFPMYEAVEDVTVAAGDPSVELTRVAVDRIEAVEGAEGMLKWMSDPEARRKFHVRTGAPRSTSYPIAWSRHGGRVRVWPTPDVDYELTVIGWRDPEYGWLTEAGGVPDLPPELHEPLLAWVMHRAFSWDDDPERAAQELRTYQDGVDQVLGEMLTEVPTAPLILHGGEPDVAHFPVEPRWVL